ncbi:hypothetical protein SNOG_10606 [Parastagonospora nodorum SN15]|uniref:Uncharacterized protein n=1 Tax=Phaeosphaeria nodorum (strain SN15 / ATCC MYA-4574 / FGSC 10173) TaxID=321614 RepID=Q0UCA8_PHANO|nr:hypothetical protein SNOG_10606 [Parastagonospora nodorum SN15]EAT82000.1 hypothetical protein SNOG_10606 [Parastagonospora nodorum SN15]
MSVISGICTLTTWCCLLTATAHGSQDAAVE